MIDASRSAKQGPPESSAVTIAVGRMEFQIATTGLSSEASRWLEARGLDCELADRLGLTSAQVVGRGRGDDWLAFPSIAHGKIVGWQFRRLKGGEPRFLGAGKVGEVPWNIDILRDQTLAQQPIVITEGRCDAIAAMQSGFLRAISVPGGAPDKPLANEGALPWIAELVDLTKDCRRIVIATDNDEPGLILQNEIAKRIGRGRCQFLTLPDGCKDLNEVLVGYGEGAVASVINAAKYLHIEGIYLPSELPPRPRLRQHVSGLPGMDDKYRVRRQDFSVWTGWPGSGKTTVFNHFAVLMAENWNWRTCFASFEQPPQTQHMWELRRLRLGKRPKDMTREDVVRADEWIEKFFRFVVPDEEKPPTLDFVFEMFATSIVRYGADMLVVDPWNEVEHSRSGGQTMTEYVGEAIRDMKRFARKWDVHLAVIAHPTKPKFQKTGEKLPEPMLDMISDSAHWWNKADVGVITHQMTRVDGVPYTQVRIAKSKVHEEIGVPGVVPMNLNVATGRYAEIVV